MNKRFRVGRAALGAGLALVMLARATSSPAEEARDIARGGLPAWIAARQTPPPTPALVALSSDGVTWLLTDWQVRAAEAGYDAYNRYVLQASDRSGLESAGKIEIEFDPHYERPTLNYVRVVRDGKIIDHTDDLKLDLVQREGELEDGLLNGRVTAVGNIKDVRVGDIVDYAITTRVTDSLWPGHFFYSIQTRWSSRCRCGRPGYCGRAAVRFTSRR